jgi:hypothetical protein
VEEGHAALTRTLADVHAQLDPAVAETVATALAGYERALRAAQTARAEAAAARSH